MNNNNPFDSASEAFLSGENSIENFLRQPTAEELFQFKTFIGDIAFNDLNQDIIFDGAQLLVPVDPRVEFAQGYPQANHFNLVIPNLNRIVMFKLWGPEAAHAYNEQARANGDNGVFSEESAFNMSRDYMFLNDYIKLSTELMDINPEQWEEHVLKFYGNQNDEGLGQGSLAFTRGITKFMKHIRKDCLIHICTYGEKRFKMISRLFGDEPNFEVWDYFSE